MNHRMMANEKQIGILLNSSVYLAVSFLHSGSGASGRASTGAGGGVGLGGKVEQLAISGRKYSRRSFSPGFSNLKTSL